ncbi:hypothetical protein F2Q69_00025236 [Brassica cretica]|uniref:Uncharacterized protein n=1 Tax=Brassica cretica TaxID=69181 RepID=A0A8S9Q7L0_BRACR|nr:hypothetical protein F2Q69_00025236 [Brassica cretica]
MAHLVEESLFDGIIWRLSRWNRRLRLSPRRLRVSLCLLDDSASLLFSSVTPRLCDSLALLSGPLMPFDSDQISSEEVLSWVMLSLLDACSLPMSSVKLDAFDGDLIRLELDACSLPMSSVKLDAFDGDLIRLEVNA